MPLIYRNMVTTTVLSRFLHNPFFQNTFSWSKNLPNFTISAALTVAVYGQRQFRQGRTGAGNGYGAPPSGNQAEYQPSASSGSQSAAAPGGDDHQGLDWLLKSVPGQPGTDYPIFAEAPETSFVCDGQVEGGKNLELVISYFSLLILKFKLVRNSSSDILVT